MPVDIPPDRSLSLNAAADACNMERQDFRKLIAPFETQGAKLPKRFNDQGQETKIIPQEFLHVFQLAAMFMQMDGLSPDGAMRQALGIRKPNHFFSALNLDIQTRKQLLELPAALLLAVSGIETKLKTPVVARLETSHLQPVLGAIEIRMASLRPRTIATILFGGMVLGGIGTAAIQKHFVFDQFSTVNTRINDASYQEGQHYAALSRQLQQLRARR